MEKSMLHTVACLYAGVGYVDGELHDTERSAAMSQLQHFVEDSETSVDEIFADAISFWENLPSSLPRYKQLVEIAKGLADTLDEHTRRSILVDLEAIVRADSRLTRLEYGMVRELATHMNLSEDDLTL
jgi:uncharacterized tellurite resistance protein B-like protein